VEVSGDVLTVVLKTPFLQLRKILFHTGGIFFRMSADVFQKKFVKRLQSSVPPSLRKLLRSSSHQGGRFSANR
jgi:hypothetical protein